MRVPEYQDPIRARWYFIPRPAPGVYDLTEYTSSNWDEDRSQDPPLGEESTTREPFTDWRDGSPPPWDVVCDCIQCPPGSPGTYWLETDGGQNDAHTVALPPGFYPLFHVGPCTFESDPIAGGAATFVLRLVISAGRQVITAGPAGGGPPVLFTWERLGSWDCKATLTGFTFIHGPNWHTDPVLDSLQSKEPNVMPLIGEVINFPAGTRPAGFLECDGSRVNQADYPKLYALWGFTFGPDLADGTFPLVDLQGRVPLGAGAGPGLTPYAVGDTGGEEYHALVTGEMPSHAHALTDPQHNHGVTDPHHNHGVTDPTHTHQLDPAGLQMAAGTGPSRSAVNAIGATLGVAFAGASMDTTDVAAATGVTVNNAATGLTVNNAATGVTMANTGGGGAHENRQPFVACRYLVRAK